MNYDVVLNANDNATLETEYAFTQGDYGNIQFSIRVKADGQYVTDATRAYIVFALPNGMIVTGDDMPKSVATYMYVFQGNELQAPGKIVVDVKLVYANGQISSNKFTFTCRPDPLADKNIPAGPYITALQKIVDDGQEKIDYLQALIDTLQEGVGETAVTRNDLQNNRDPVDAGLKAIDANMAQNLFFKSEVINTNATTTAGFAADARQLNPSVPGSLAAQLATTNSNLVKVQSGYMDIVTSTNFAGEYQGSVTIASIVAALSLSDKTILTVICRGGNLTTDGAIIPKHVTNGTLCSFSGAASGTYRMQFSVFYK